jgi:hypothetical protein
VADSCLCNAGPSKILTKGLTGLIRLANKVAVTIALKVREEFAFPHCEAWAWRPSCIADSPS